MLEKIREALAEIKKEFDDSRLQYCAVEAQELIAVQEMAAGRCVLTGGVLDEATMTAVTTHLASQFPDIAFDAESVTVLRQRPLKLMTVGTNLAGVYRQPSRLTERVSEVMNGRIVELLMERSGYVFARQMDGYLGWIRREYLTESPPLEPTHIVIEPVSLLRNGPDAEAGLVTRVMSGTLVAVTAVSSNWAQIVLAGERDGWIPLDRLRDLEQLPEDDDGRRQQMVADSTPFTGVQYLWGGCTGQGIDCSGLVQTLHRMVGVNIVRDADMQFEGGTAVEPPFKPGDLLFFGSGKGHRSISHVGMSLGGWKIIHSSGPRNGVYEDDVQAVSWLRDTFRGARTFVD